MIETTSRLRREKGFTLIELLIVIVVLGILAAIVLFAVGSTTDDAEKSACASDKRTVLTALEAYKAQAGDYPAAATSDAAYDLLTGVTAPPVAGTGPWLKEKSSKHTIDIAAGKATGDVTGVSPCP